MHISILKRSLINYWKVLVILVLITYGSLTTPTNLHTPVWWEFPNSDKIIHGLLYMFLTFVMATAQLRQLKKINYLITIVFPLIFGSIMEVLQYYLTTQRSAEWFDLLANSLGILTAVVLLIYIRRKNIQLIIKYL